MGPGWWEWVLKGTTLYLHPLLVPLLFPLLLSWSCVNHLGLLLLPLELWPLLAVPSSDLIAPKPVSLFALHVGVCLVCTQASCLPGSPHHHFANSFFFFHLFILCAQVGLRITMQPRKTEFSSS